MRNLSFYVLLLLLAMSSVWSAPTNRVTAAQLKAEIQASGARAVLLKYYDTPAWSLTIMPGIKSATPAWLSAAEMLKSQADATASEDLGLALYSALEVAPLRVAPVLARIYGSSIEEVCNVSFEAEEPKQGKRAYLQSIRVKLALARTKKERAIAVACSHGLELSQATASP